jgi:hypothetical protein
MIIIPGLAICLGIPLYVSFLLIGSLDSVTHIWF